MNTANKVLLDAARKLEAKAEQKRREAEKLDKQATEIREKVKGGEYEDED